MKNTIGEIEVAERSLIYSYNDLKDNAAAPIMVSSF